MSLFMGTSLREDGRLFSEAVCRWKKKNQRPSAYLRLAGSFPSTPETVFQVVKEIREQNLLLLISIRSPRRI